MNFRWEHYIHKANRISAPVNWCGNMGTPRGAHGSHGQGRFDYVTQEDKNRARIKISAVRDLEEELDAPATR